MDAVTPPPDFAELRRQIEEVREEMSRAIEARDVPAIERVFVRAMHVLADAQGLAARYKQEKNVESRYASNEIVLGIEHLRGQWLITTERVGLRFLQPKNTKFGAPTGGVMLDAAGQPPRIFINRKKSQQLQAFAKLTEQQVKAALADKTRMLTMTGILRLYAKPKRMDYPFHPICDDYAPFTSEEMQDLRKSLRERGLLVPIVTWRKQTVDGKHRTRGCKEEGIPLRYRDITKQCPTEDEMRAYVAALNEHRRANTKPLTSKQKRERIEAALKADPERSDVVIAMEVGATHPTVGHIRQELEAEGVVNFTAPSERKSQTGKKGEGQRRTPRKPKRTPAVNDAPDDVAQCDKPALEPIRPNISNIELPAPESAAKEPMWSNNDAPAQHDLAPAKTDVAPTPAGEPAPPSDPWADRRALFRDSIRGLRELKDDFGPLIATMPSGEADEAKDVVFALSAALHAAIDRATPVEKPMSPAA